MFKKLNISNNSTLILDKIEKDQRNYAQKNIFVTLTYFYFLKFASTILIL